MMVKLSKHHSNLNILNWWGLRNLLTLLWRLWHKKCATIRWVQKRLEFMDTYEFRLLWISSSNHCDCDSLSSLFCSDSVVSNRKTISTVNIAVTASSTVLKIEPKFFMCLFVIISWLQHFDIISCFSLFHVSQIHFCMNTYRQRTLGWLGYVDWWLITQNSIKLKVFVTNYW